MCEDTTKTRVLEDMNVKPGYDIDMLRSALSYKARPDDLFLLTYPKSGTTWMEIILYGLLNEGEAFDSNMAEYFARTPYLDLIGEQGINNMHRPGSIKTHLAFDRVPYNDQAKYICVVRNPKDVCVSFYHFLVNVEGNEFENAPFSFFFEAFINEELCFGGYFQHLRSLWKHKDDVNVFFVSYEEMKRDIRGVICRLARFLNIELSTDLLEKVVAHSSFDYMKNRYEKAYKVQALVALANESPTAPWPLDKESLQTFGKYELVRKGVVGGWSSTMTEEQCRRLDQALTEKTADLPGLAQLFLQGQP